MGYAYDESPFVPLRTTTSGTSLPDKDAEIARLRAELDAVTKERDASRLLSEGLHASNVALRAERDEAITQAFDAGVSLGDAMRDISSARAALDKERDACDLLAFALDKAADTRREVAAEHRARRAAEAKEPPHA